MVVRRRSRPRPGDRSPPPARRSGFTTKKAAEAALRDLATAADAGTAAVSRSRITLSQFLNDWLETVKPRVRETTWVSYRMAVERITRQIGAVQLQSLTPLQVEGLYATLLEHGGAGGRALAPKTVRNCHIVLRRALADAERLGLVARNPAAAAKAVSAPRGEQRTWSSEEIQRFFDVVAGAVDRPDPDDGEQPDPHRSTEDRQEPAPRLARHGHVRRAQGASHAPTRGTTRRG